MILDPAIVGLILFLGLFMLILLRVPVAYALALAVVPVLLLEPRLTPVMLLQRMLKSYDSFILLLVPFFIMAANIMNASGITNKLIRFSKALVGHLPGGLAHVNVVVSMFFAGISGSSTADAVGIGSVLIPAMIKEKYDRFFTVAITACSSVMGVIIPPQYYHGCLGRGCQYLCGSTVSCRICSGGYGCNLSDDPRTCFFHEEKLS